MTVLPDSARPKFVCETCNAAFKTRNALFRHLRKSETCGGPEGPGEAKGVQVLTPEAQSSQDTHKKVTNRPHKKEKEKPSEYVEHKFSIETRPDSYEQELQPKVKKMEMLLTTAAGNPHLPQMQVYQSPPEYFRMRCEFNVCQNYKGIDVGYFMWHGRERKEITHFPMGDKLICDKLMPGLLETLRAEESLRQSLFQVNFHTTLHGDAVVSLLYRTAYQRAAKKHQEEQKQRAIRREEELAAMGLDVEDDADDLEVEVDEGPLTADWEAAATRLQAALGGASIVGKSRGRKRVVGRDWVQEWFNVAGAGEPISYRQLEGFFSQPNGAVAQHMLSWARAVARADNAEVGEVGPARADDLLELYCGNANFAVALAPCFRAVLATELVKSLVDAARQNAVDNHAANVEVARVSSEELAQAIDGVRSFQRLAHIDLAKYRLSTLLVDPPRAGLGPDVATFAARFPRIIYISCNPVTLAEDLKILLTTHEIARVAAFDQFAYTEHLEAGVLLLRRNAPVVQAGVRCITEPEGATAEDVVCDKHAGRTSRKANTVSRIYQPQAILYSMGLLMTLVCFRRRLGDVRGYLGWLMRLCS